LEGERGQGGQAQIQVALVSRCCQGQPDPANVFGLCGARAASLDVTKVPRGPDDKQRMPARQIVAAAVVKKGDHLAADLVVYRCLSQRMEPTSEASTHQ